MAALEAEGFLAPGWAVVIPLTTPKSSSEQPRHHQLPGTGFVQHLLVHSQLDNALQEVLAGNTWDESKVDGWYCWDHNSFSWSGC